MRELSDEFVYRLKSHTFKGFPNDLPALYPRLANIMNE
jgi:hypothetical protein